MLPLLILGVLAVVMTSQKSEAAPPTPPTPTPSAPKPTAPPSASATSQGAAPGGTGGKAPPWNPPPPGAPLKESEVTPLMRMWAIDVLGSNYPMHTFVTRLFDEGKVVHARTEWHTVQAATGKHGVFRGVSLYKGPGW